MRNRVDLYGLLVAAVTFVDPASLATKSVYILTALGLVTLAVVSLFTGFMVKFLPFKLCPFIFSASALLISLGGIIMTEATLPCSRSWSTLPMQMEHLAHGNPSSFQ